MRIEFVEKRLRKLFNSFAVGTSFFWLVCASVAGLFLFSTMFSAQAASAKQPPVPADTKTNAVAATNQQVVIEIPKSVFIWNPKERGFGRDPFFPPKPVTSVTTTPTNQMVGATQQGDVKPVPPPKPKYEFVLNGLIGKIACIVNGKQIYVGDTEMVPVGGSKVKVRCDKIEGNTAFITIFTDDGSTETRELRLKTGIK